MPENASLTNGVLKQGSLNGHSIKYYQYGKLGVFEGDILVPATNSNTINGAGRSNEFYRWPRAPHLEYNYNISQFLFEVMFYIDPSLTNPQRVLDAIAHWESKTNLRFTRLYSLPAGVIEMIYFVPGAVCASYVGMQQGGQTIILSPECTTSNTIHEIGHAIGLWHENTRMDRDNYLTINWNNIQDGKSHNFQKYIDQGEDGFDSQTFDFASIMMYGAHSFSKNGLPTIQKKDGSTNWTDYGELSAEDIRTVNFMYPPIHYLKGSDPDAEGAGLAVGLINNNQIPDVVFMANGSPTSGADVFRYIIGYDLDSKGNPTSYSPIKSISGMSFVAEGAGVALADIDGNGQIDIVLMVIDAPSGPNEFRYKIGYNINTNGDASNWSAVKQISGLGDSSFGGGITIGDIDKNGVLDILLMAYDQPSGSTQIRYKIGYNINANGNASFWSGAKYTSGLGSNVDGTAAQLTDIDGNGTLDLVFFADDNPVGANEFRYKIGFNLDNNGNPSHYGSMNTFPGVGHLSQGGGMAFVDVDGNGINEIILMGYDAPPTVTNSYRYRVGFNINSLGVSTDWR
jgi:hypothetical protein